MLSLVLGTAFAVLCLQASLKDMTSFTIPNWINGGLVLLFFPAALVSGLGWSALGAHLLVALIAFLVGFALFSFRLFGGGDAKMVPAVLLWIGPLGVLDFIFGVALGGGLLAFVILSLRKAVPAELAPSFAQPALDKDAGVPYGIAITAGAFWAMPHSPILSDFLSQLANFN
ncbi:MAG: prepilin peptidase [Pseudomonadota bacterium]